jgi:integrase
MTQPYNRNELRALQATLDQRWPKLPREEAEKWLPRVKEGRCPYSRVRVHAISCQLDAIICLSLHLALRRSEIFRLTVNDLHTDNAGVVAGRMAGSLDGARMVPWTSRAYYAVDKWLECRFYLGAEHDRPWLNLHSAPAAHLPMTRWTFDKLLATYVGSDWSLSRLRLTSAVAWSRVGLAPERLRELLGLARIQDVLCYLQPVPTGSLERDVDRLNGDFIRQLQQVPVAA